MNGLNNSTIPHGSTPVPDPTVLTTQQLTIGLAALREILETRLDAMDVATELNKAATDKIPCFIKDAIGNLQSLSDEKFSKVEGQFKERDVRADKIAELGQKALEAALSAAKEAVGKTELAFTKQIDATSEQIQSEKRATDGKFDDMKARLSILETSINTRSVITGESRQTQAWLLPMIFVGMVSLSGVIVGIIGLFVK